MITCYLKTLQKKSLKRIFKNENFEYKTKIMKKSNFKFAILLQVIILLNVGMFSSSLKSQWVDMSNGLGTYNIVRTFYQSGTNIFVGTKYGIYLTTNNGVNWNPINNGLPVPVGSINSITFNGTYLFVTTGNGIYRSSNNGNNWVFSGLSIGPTLNTVFSVNVNIYVGTAIGAYISTDNGVNWNSITGLNSFYIKSFASIGSNIYASYGTFNSGVLLSTNNGNNWVTINNGLPNNPINALTTIGTNLFAVIPGSGVYFTTNNGSNWNATSSSLTTQYVMSLTTDNTNLIAGTYEGGGVFFSSNNGERWIKKNQGFVSIPTNVYSLLIANNYIFSGIDSNKVWRRNFIDPLPLAPILISPANNSVGNSLNLNAIWRSSEYAFQYNFILATDINFTNVILNDTTLIDTIKSLSNFTPYTNYFWKAKARSNAGWGGFSSIYTFRTIGVPTQVVLSSPASNAINQSIDLAFKWFKSVDQIVLSKLSTNTENKDKYEPDVVSKYWFELATDASFVNTVLRDSSIVDTTKFISNLSSTTDYWWRVKAKNQAGWSIFSWNFKFTTGTTGITIIGNTIPDKYELHLNFPNPFNPITKIKFDVPNESPIEALGDGKVVLKVYDVMGREIQTLVNEPLKPGTYETTFDGSSLNSGIYFARFESGSFKQTIKMLMIK